MTKTVLVLAEDALQPVDVTHIATLYDDADISYQVLVPADTARNILVSLIDHLSLGELREALDEVLGREPEPATARATAAEQLRATLDAFEGAGKQASGQVVDDDPLPALRAAVASTDVHGIAVVTQPHALEDTFHQDWASRAREELHVPVLHLYSGTSQLG